MGEQHVVILLVKLAAAGSLASILLRSGKVKRLLSTETRTVEARLMLSVAFSLVYGLSVATRVFTRNQYMAVDLGAEGSFLAGLVGGYVTGLTSGLVIALPAVWNGEWATLAMFAAAGVLGALLRDSANDVEEIWRLSPFFDLGLYRILFKWRNLQRAVFHFAFYLLAFFLEFLRATMSAFFGRQYLFALTTEWTGTTPIETLGVYVSTAMAVTLSLAIWNNARYEGKLEAQNRLLAEARIAALMSQINPHFLFNTLNAISSLIRVDPDKAREMIYKLSAILRRLLKKQENLCPLRDELAFIDDYLGIEMIRFGAKLRVIRDVAPGTLECMVPSMLLQPIVENSIRHGLSPKVEGGTILIKSYFDAGRLVLVMEDDGVGIPEDRLARVFEQDGIGIGNVNERLRVLYGDAYRIAVDSKIGKYTRTEIEIPLQQGVLV